MALSIGLIDRIQRVNCLVDVCRHVILVPRTCFKMEVRSGNVTFRPLYTYLLTFTHLLVHVNVSSVHVSEKEGSV